MRERMQTALSQHFFPIKCLTLSYCSMGQGILMILTTILLAFLHIQEKELFSVIRADRWNAVSMPVTGFIIISTEPRFMNEKIY